MTIDLATKISSEMLEIGTRLNAALTSIKENCSEQEFKQYRFGFGNAMGSIFLEILEPIFKEHPTLEPPGLKRNEGSSKFEKGCQ
jgi:hypothetical protein